MLASEAGCDFDFLKGHCQDKNHRFYRCHPPCGAGAGWLGSPWSAGLQVCHEPALRKFYVHVNRGDLAEHGFCLGPGLAAPAHPCSSGRAHPRLQRPLMVWVTLSSRSWPGQVLTVAKHSPQAGLAGHREGTWRSQHSLIDSSPSLTPKGGAKAPDDPHSAAILTDSLEEMPNLDSSTTWKLLVQGMWQRTRAT